MSKLSDLLAKAKKQVSDAKAKHTLPAIPAHVEHVIPEANPIPLAGTAPVIYNTEQNHFIQTALDGKSAVLIGAAGTGKTTTMKGTVAALLQSKYFPQLSDTTHKHLPADTPGIIFTSYTRRAVQNLRKALPTDIRENCITIHKLLEYGPVYYEIYDETTMETRNTMRFEPSRGRHRKLSQSIKTIVIDEASMVSVALYHELWNALPEPMAVQFIFLGDIQQLPPIFGSAILGYAMVSKPVISLTHVYRQALESPIIRLAHRILSGVPIDPSELPTWDFPGQLKLHPWKKSISADNALITLAAFFKKSYDAKEYLPEEDMILIPFNKSCGTDELNRHIANHIARSHHLVTYEIIAGFMKYYYSVGDRVMYEKEDAVITSITYNRLYLGKRPQEPSDTLDYWGCLQGSSDPTADIYHHISDEPTNEDIDSILDRMAASGEDIDDSGRVKAASHEITVRITESGREVTLKQAAEVNALILSYAITVHKAQGSEWRKVFFCLHKSHNTMLQRELLYTAVTRARKELYVICEPDSFIRGVSSQKIKGDTIESKIEHFKGRKNESDLEQLSEMAFL